MAIKLSPTEFLDRHVKEVDAILSLFEQEKTLQYAEIRKRLSLDLQSQRERGKQIKEGNKPKDLPIKYETQLMRILNTLCDALILEKIPGKKVYYNLIIPKNVAAEIAFRNRVRIDEDFFHSIMEDKRQLEEKHERCQNRNNELISKISEQRIEIIDLKQQLNKLQFEQKNIKKIRM